MLQRAVRLRFFLFCAPLFFCVCCKAQHSSIRKAYAFSKQQIPGANRTDERGNPVEQQIRTNYFIYLETSDSSRPQIDSVSNGTLVFSASVFPVHHIPEYVGTTGANDSIVLLPSPGNFLWRVELETLNEKNMSANNGEFLLRGHWKGRSYSWKIRSNISLQPDQTY